MRSIGAILVAAIALGGCSAGSGHPLAGSSADVATVARSTAVPSTAETARRTASSSPPSAPSTTFPPVVPVDPSIDPVSLSKPSADAAEALRICQVVDVHGVEKVTGMGRIDHARDAIRYAPLTGREPELATDEPAWMITFGGELPMPKINQVWIDPTCIVVNDDGGIFATGPRISATGMAIERPADASRPTLALPPLLP